jgi:glutathione synthase/RimK-type ligase-like ATP-grasp enzyme
MERKINRIIRELCEERRIPLKTYSRDWVMQLEIGGEQKYIIGYNFPLNNATAQALCDDKSALSEVLLAHGVDAVRHHFFLYPTHASYDESADGRQKMLELLARYGEIVCKDNEGTGGRDVYKVANEQELDAAAKRIFDKEKSLAIAPYYDIEEEYRVIILDGKAELAYRKVRQGGWKHNLGQGALPEIVEDGRLERELASLASAAMSVAGVCFASVDIIRVGGEHKVLEINSGIMMENFAGASLGNYEVAKRIYGKALDLVAESALAGAAK